MTTKDSLLLLAGVGLGVGLAVMGTLWYQIRTAPVKVELVQEKPTRVNDFDALNKSTSDKKMALEAMAAAEELVKEKLVAPSTARFSKEGAYLSSLPDCALSGTQKGKLVCLEQFPTGTFDVRGTYEVSHVRPVILVETGSALEQFLIDVQNEAPFNRVEGEGTPGDGK